MKQARTNGDLACLRWSISAKKENLKLHHYAVSVAENSQRDPMPRLFCVSMYCLTGSEPAEEECKTNQTMNQL